jgi:hypothetical protein
MESCWAEDENVRPRFEEVVVALDEMRAADGCMRYGSSRCVSRVIAALLMCSTGTVGTPWHQLSLLLSVSLCSMQQSCTRAQHCRGGKRMLLRNLHRDRQLSSTTVAGWQ